MPKWTSYLKICTVSQEPITRLTPFVYIKILRWTLQSKRKYYWCTIVETRLGLQAPTVSPLGD